MAATRELTDEIDHNLRVVRGKVGALPKTERWWTAPETVISSEQRRADRADFRIEWGDVIDRWSWLEKMYGTAAMRAEQAAQDEALLSLLGDALPMMERLRLEPPPKAVLKRAAAARHEQPTAATAD
jgi:hypothetical protein